MADILTRGHFIGSGKPEPVHISVSVTDNEEVVDAPTVTLFVTPADLVTGAERRVETFLSVADAESLAQMLLDFAKGARQAIESGEDVSNDYSG